MRLSFGFVRGNSLNCLYHGWQYEAGSRCMKIPAHPDLEVPPSIKANAFEATESGGLILLNQGTAELPPVVLAGLPVASLAIDADIGTLLQLTEARPLAGQQAFETLLEGVALTIGWHLSRPSHVMLHVVARDPNTESRALVALHRLRAAAERQAA